MCSLPVNIFREETNRQIHLQIKAKLAKFHESTGGVGISCLESVTVEKDKVMCYVGSAVAIRNNEVKDTLPGDEWTLRYERKIPSPGTEGGKFWLQIKGSLLAFT